MIYAGEDTLDFSDKDLVIFAQQAAMGDRWRPEKFEIEGYSRSLAKPIEIGVVPAPAEGWVVRWTILETWEISQQGRSGLQKVGETTVRIHASRPMTVSTSISLLIKDGLPDSIISKIERIFSSYIYPSSGDVDAFIENAVTQDSELNPLMVGLANIIDVTPSGEPIYDTREQEFLQRWMRSASEENDYSFRVINRKVLDFIEYPRNLPEQTNIGDPVEAAKNAAEVEQGRADCPATTPYTWEIGRTDWLPESRTTFKWEHIRSGCINLHFWTSTTEWRNRDLVAEGWVSTPDWLTHVENAIKQCAKESALVSSVYLLLFTDLATALAAFRALFVACIERKFDEAMACVNAGVIVDTHPDGDWY